MNTAQAFVVQVVAYYLPLNLLPCYLVIRKCGTQAVRLNPKETDFIDIVAWKNTAEFVSKYFSKGTMAAVSGRLQIRDWTDKDGNKRKSAEIVADNVYFAESKKRDGLAQAKRDLDDLANSKFEELDDDDGELPF
jgi:single-strand DNA-binding protein